MDKDFKRKIVITSILIVVVVAILLLIIFLPDKGHDHSLGQDTYNYETGIYAGTCQHKGCKEKGQILGGSKAYPYLVKDKDSALKSLEFVKSRQTGENAADYRIYLKLVDNVVFDEGEKHFVVEAGMNVGLDLNGHSILDKTTQTIDNSGTFEIFDSSEKKEGFVGALAHKSAAIVNQVGGDFTLTSGGLCGTINSESANGNLNYLLKNHGKVVINNGFLKIEKEGEVTTAADNSIYNGEFTILVKADCLLNNEGSAKINGGKFSVENLTNVIKGNGITIISNSPTLTGFTTGAKFSGATPEGDFTLKNFEENHSEEQD